MEIALIAIQVCELMKYPYLNIGFKKKKKKKKKKTKTKKKERENSFVINLFYLLLFWCL